MKILPGVGHLENGCDKAEVAIKAKSKHLKKNRVVIAVYAIALVRLLRTRDDRCNKTGGII